MLDLIQHPVLSGKLVVKLSPIGVGFFYQFQLPGASPILDLFLTLDRLADVVVHLEPNECVHAMLLGEPIDEIVFVFVDSLYEVGRDSGVQGAISFAGENVDVAWFHSV